jgi:hypothetical protein
MLPLGSSKAFKTTVAIGAMMNTVSNTVVRMIRIRENLSRDCNDANFDLTKPVMLERSSLV